MMELSGRLIVDFGKHSRTSARWLKSFDRLPVEQIRADGQQQAFPGFEHIRLSYDELKAIIDHPAANPDWHHALSSVAGIYAICVTADSLSGEFDRRRLYIGSANGKRNLWQRWSEYARTGHGENKMLKALLEKHPEALTSFQFSVLQTAPITMGQNEILGLERSYKQKLQTERFGLNNN